MSSSSDSGSEDLEMRFFHDFRLRAFWIIRQRNSRRLFACRNSRHRAAYSHVSQPLNPWQGRTGRGRPRRGAYRFEPEIVKKAEMQGAVPGCSCCRAFPMITTMSIKDSATMTGRLHLSLFVFSLQFIFGSFGRKECLNTPRPVHHELAVTVSHRATPIPALNSRGWRGLTYASVEEADHQCWLVVVSNIVFVRVFSVEYSNMYNLSINELCILRGNLYICPHNCIVCVRMVISFYPATRIHVHFSHEVRSFCATAPASGAGPAAKFFFPRQFRTPSTNSFAYSQSELHDMNINDWRLRNKSTHARDLLFYCSVLCSHSERPLSLILNNYAG